MSSTDALVEAASRCAALVGDDAFTRQLEHTMQLLRRQLAPYITEADRPDLLFAVGVKQDGKWWPGAVLTFSDRAVVAWITAGFRQTTGALILSYKNITGVVDGPVEPATRRGPEMASLSVEGDMPVTVRVPTVRGGANLPTMLSEILHGKPDAIAAEPVVEPTGDPRSAADESGAPAVPDRGDTARVQRRERLLKALEGVSAISTLPDGRTDQLPAAKELFDAANDLARFSELESLAAEIKALTEAYPGTARAFVLEAQVRADDRFVLGHGDPHLELLRIAFSGETAEVPELEARLRATADGSLILETTNADERTSLAFATLLQLMVKGDEPTLDGLGRYLDERGWTRGRDPFRLEGAVGPAFALGAHVTRAAWGGGTVTFTDRRVLGVLFTHTLPGDDVPKREAAWMPRVGVWPGDISSVILFGFPREAVSEVEVGDRGFPLNRMPWANVHGHNFLFSLETNRVFDNDHLVRPKKGVLGDAIRGLRR